MTQELLAALILCLFAPLNAIIDATASTLIGGFTWAFGNRDTTPALPEWAHRLKRAHANLIENLTSFVGIVLIAHVLNVHDNMTVMAAWTFVGARLVYALIYTAGITHLRTVLYLASLGALGVLAWRILVTTMN